MTSAHPADYNSYLHNTSAVYSDYLKAFTTGIGQLLCRYIHRGDIIIFSMLVLQAIALSKQYNNVTALSNLNISVEKEKFSACWDKMVPAKQQQLIFS